MTYRYLKIHHLLSKCAHLVVEAKPVFASVFRGEDIVALSFLGTIHDGPLIRANDTKVYVKGSTGLNLCVPCSIVLPRIFSYTHRKVKGDFGSHLLHVGVETCPLISGQVVRKCRCGGALEGISPQSTQTEYELHRLGG